MRAVTSLGECPKCEAAEIVLYKTKSYKRFAKCESEECNFSYPLPKAGKIENTTLLCPKIGIPILLVIKTDSKNYFWTESPCFTCREFSQCSPINELKAEFKELKVHGY